MIHFSKIQLRSLFLFDGAGALVSTLVSALVLPIFSDFFGIAPRIFHILAGLAFIYFIYDLIVYLSVKTIKFWMVKMLIFINVAYCLLTGYLLIFLPEITHLGQAVLIAEILIILGVVAIEIKVLGHSQKKAL